MPSWVQQCSNVIIGLGHNQLPVPAAVLVAEGIQDMAFDTAL